MQSTKKILVCGSGVAGPTCAYWLHKYGYSTVIVEKAPALRDGGQNVDIKGAGQHVIDMMSLAEKIEAKNTQECGQKYLDAAGRVVAVLPKGALGSLTNDFEILRGDFAQVLFESTKDDCEYRFGRFITALEEKQDGISVTFDNGEVEDFELVICAEGIHSSTRDMVMAGQTRFRYLGAYMAFFKIPRRVEDDRWAYSVNGFGGTFITLRPGNETETTVLVTFLRRDPGMNGDTPAARKGLLRQALEGRGAIADRITANLHTVDDFYFGPMSQVQASTWSQGRIVLLGDAAFCPTPFTGAGTALALVAAYVLAGEIKRSDDHSQAFAVYERLVRPYVEASQSTLNPRRIRLMHPTSRCGINLTHLAQRLMASSAVQSQFRSNAAKRAQKIADDFHFADYS
ncbi:FAD-dependent monooxygenase [Mycobacterium sp. ITM-2016-00316]|uniref:FAD-dependent monooxygenase n=1 Tax=Mycobacterium sp. ITM-2016-00316 TaxID=2099695 RepID=UPI000CFA3ED9|nr:FAD-dependent monooxygenase [Mycobacterium sp. ITM-2016-00316]WNG82054.1 FAD-dependent monooxygenase [Mycobacterium sp. ITM-2016-00316]